VTLTERPRFLMVPGIGLAAEDWERTMGRLTSRGVDPRGPGGGAATGDGDPLTAGGPDRRPTPGQPRGWALRRWLATAAHETLGRVPCLVHQ
jgi:hypothetical protein